MTAQTVTGAVDRRDEIDLVIGKVRNWQADIAMAAAAHVKPSAVIRVTQGALRRNPKLLDAAIANPQSLLYALLDCARLGHEPDTDDYYLVPFGNEVTGIEGYKGIIERMFRAGGVSSVVAQVVRQRDRYASRGEDTPPAHEYDAFADPEARGPLRGAYAYATFPGGRCSQVIQMGKAEIMRHKAKSRGSDKSDSPWRQWEESMWKKTVLRGLEPYVPTSTEYRQEQLRAVSAYGTVDPQDGSAPVPVTASQAAQLAGSGISTENGRTEPQDIHDAEVIEERPDPTAPAAASGPNTGSSTAPAAASPSPTGGTGPGLPPAGMIPAGTEHAGLGPRPKGQPAAAGAVKRMEDLIAQIGLGPPEHVGELIRWLCPGYDATRAEVRRVTEHLAGWLEAAHGDVEAAADGIWSQMRNALGETGDGGDE